MQTLALLMAAVTVACSGEVKVSDSRGGVAKEFSIASVRPLAAVPGSEVAVAGTGLADGIKIVVGDNEPVDLRVTDSETGSFVMPAAITTTGLVEASAVYGTKSQAFALYALGDNSYPLITKLASEVCAGEKYFDANGDVQQGTRACGSENLPPPTIPADCATDGQVGCVTTFAHRAVEVKDLGAKVVLGQKVADVDGTVVPSPALCSADGATACVASAAFPAAKRADFSDSDIRDGVTIAGVQGTLLGAPPSCAADGGTGCLANASFRAAATAGLADKVLSTATLAGIAGNVVLPAEGKVLTGTSYGVGGTGSSGDLTLPSGGNVLAGTGTYGDPGAPVTPSLSDRGTWNLTTAFPGAGYYGGVSNVPAEGDIRAGVEITGVTGNVTPSPAACAADGATSCVAVADFPAVDKVANITANAGKIRDTVTIAGVAGTLSDCADGGSGCFVVGPTQAAAVIAGAEDKILLGESVAGVPGNVTLPGEGKVLTGTSYGVGGTGSSGDLTLPSGGNVLAGTGTYGDPGAPVTPSLSDRGTWNLTTAFPGAGYYAGVSDAPTASLRSSAQIAGTAGAVLDCASANSQGCYVTGTYYASTLCAADGGTSCVVDNGTNYKAAASGVLAAGSIKRGVVIGGVTGTFPSAASPMPRYSDSGATTNTQADGGVTTDLTNFITQLTTDGSFEFWDATGMRRTGSGDSDIVAANVATGIVFENLSVTGTLAGGGGSDCTDAGQIGCLTTATYRSTKNFRNTARTALYNNTTAPASASLDIWDTIDDYNNNLTGLPGDQPWGASYAAGSSYWQDVTPGGTCGAGLDCIKQDKITGLMWSKQNTLLDFSDVAAGDWPCGGSSCTQTSGNVTSGGGSGTYASGAGMRWWDAAYACNLLNARNYGGYNTGWRLPTQKEMLQANVHGIRAAADTNWVTGSSVYRWSASTNSTSSTSAWYVDLAFGTTTNFNASKTSANGFVCVR